MSRPATVVAALIFVGAVALAIYGYVVVSGDVEGSYWAPLIPVFVFIYAGIAVAVVAGLDSAIRWGIRKRRTRFAKPS